MKCFLPFTNNTGRDLTENGAVWPDKQTRYHEYDSALSCSQADAQFRRLSLPQQIAQSKPGRPSPATGMAYQQRNCGGVVPPYDEDDDYQLQGIEVGGFPSTDTNLLDPVYRFENGRIIIDHDRHNDPNDRWLVNSKWRDQGIAGYSQTARMPCRIQKFRIDPSRPRSHWRDQSYNATMNIHFI